MQKSDIYVYLRFIPLFRVAIPFITGIIIQMHFSLPPYFSMSIAFASIVVLILTEKYTNLSTAIKYEKFAVISTFMLFFAFGQLVFIINKHNKTELIKGKYYYAVIDSEVEEKENTYKTIIKILGVQTDSNSTGLKPVKCLAYFEKDTLKPFFGELIIISASPEEIRNNGNPYEFDYQAYLERKNIYYRTYIKSGYWQKIDTNAISSIYYYSALLRKKLLNIYLQNNINGQEFAVLSALTLGYKQLLDPETRQAFSASGAMHVLAVSGLHVGIIYMILSKLLSFFDKKRSFIKIKAIIIILSIWGFAFITGLSASVQRSAIMFTFLSFNTVIRRKTNIYNTLAASAVFILSFNPYMIAEVGFQLSYLAVLAIVTLQPILSYIWLPSNRVSKYFWDLMTVSIAAQIGTSPIALYYFHQFPNYFIITNFIVIPAAFLIILLAVIVLITSFIPVVSSFFAILLNFIVRALNKSVFFIEDLPFSTIQDININIYQVILFYILIISLFSFHKTKSRQPLYISALSIILILGLNTLNKIKNSGTELTVYNSGKNTIISITHNRKAVFIVDSSVINNPAKLDFIAKNHTIKKGIKEKIFISIDSLPKAEKKISDAIYLYKNFVIIGNNIGYIATKSKNFEKGNKNRINLDFIVLCNNTDIKIKELFRQFMPKKIVISSSNVTWRRKAWAKECIHYGIRYFDVKKYGALIGVYNSYPSFTNYFL